MTGWLVLIVFSNQVGNYCCDSNDSDDLGSLQNPHFTRERLRAGNDFFYSQSLNILCINFSQIFVVAIAYLDLGNESQIH